jgi:hypothetical protein
MARMPADSRPRPFDQGFTLFGTYRSLTSALQIGTWEPRGFDDVFLDFQ